MITKFGNPEKNNNEIKELINKTNIDSSFLNNDSDFRDFILQSIDKNFSILDIGKSLRNKYEILSVREKKTLDINNFKDYPDYQLDLSDNELKIETTELYEKFDVVVCLAVLEHVYDPFIAIKNIEKTLKKDGVVFGYVPYLYFYHAPKNLTFQDFYRFSKDGISYLLRNFKDTTIYPSRGKISTLLHLILGSFWKRFFENKFLSSLLNKIVNNNSNVIQSSGYYFIAKKK